MGGQPGEMWPVQGEKRLVVRGQRAGSGPHWQPEGKARPAALPSDPRKPPADLCSAELGDIP